MSSEQARAGIEANRGAKVSAGETQSLEQRRVAVRFAHVDAAGLIFYPRYLEILAEHYPALPLTQPPYQLSLHFPQAYHLGDVMLMDGTHSTDLSRWDIQASQDGQLSFAARWHLVDGAAKEFDHNQNMFCASKVDLGHWAVGKDRQLHLSRYLEYVNAAVEQWFEQVLHWPFARMLADGSGVPTVRLNVACHRFPRDGDEFYIAIELKKLGARSLCFMAYLVSQKRCFLCSEQVLVHVDMGVKPKQSAAWPAAFRYQLLDQSVSG